MKIAILSRSTVKHFTSGGMETHLSTLAEGLAGEGHSVSVITTSYPNISRVESEDITELDKGVKYHYLGGTTPGLNPLSIWEKIFANLGILKRGEVGEGDKDFFDRSKEVFKKLNEENQFDLVISQSTAAQALPNNSGIPIVSVIHGTIHNEIYNRRRSITSLKGWCRFLLIDLPKWYLELYTTNKRFFKSVAQVIAVSDVLKDQFIKEHPFAKDKVKVIYNGVDTNIFSPSKEKYNDFVLLYVGRLEREKGVDITLKALAEIKDQNYTLNFKIIGDGGYRKELEKLSSNLGLNDMVEFLGNVPNNRLGEYYGKSHVFVMPTRRIEGHPVTISEAFCSGLPLIATKMGGIRNVLVDGETGFFIDKDDYKTLAKRIKDIYNNTDQLKKISSRVADVGAKKYSKGAMLQKYLELIKNFHVDK